MHECVSTPSAKFVKSGRFGLTKVILPLDVSKLPHEMTMVEYAAHRGCSKAAVSLKVQARKIPFRAEGGHGSRDRLFFDPILCDAAWIESTVDPGARPIPKPIVRNGRPRKEHADALKLLRSVAPSVAPKAPKRQKTAEGTKKSKMPVEGLETGEDEEEESEQVQLMRRKALASVQKLEAEAMSARIAVEKEAGLLGYTDDLEELYLGNISDARDKLMYLTTMLKSKFTDINPEHIEFIDKWIMDAFISLGKMPERKIVHIENKVKDENG